MSLPKTFDDLPLPHLLTTQHELAELIHRRREEAAIEVRKTVEQAADELGISVRQLLNGTTKRQRKSKSDASENINS